LFPEPPEELQGTPLKVEYVSILAQAQKSIGISSVERFVGFVGNLAKANPAALDKLNIDQTIDEYGNMLGVPATIVNSDDEVQATREQRAQQQQQQQMMAMAQQAGATAKTLSDTNTADPSLLKTLSDAAQQPAVTQ
ncbi:portal protein, partial [Klebsiella pneumoniae]